jgi:hypothetical protein
VRDGARYWWIPLITGVAWLVVAWLVLRLNQTSITRWACSLEESSFAAGVNEAAVAVLLPGGCWRIWRSS